MKQPPEGWPRISSAVFYDDASAAIDFLTRAFGFEVRLRIEGEGGRIEHSELTFGEGLIMVGEAGKVREQPMPTRSPRSVGGANTQAMCICVDDVDAHAVRARAAGAVISAEPSTHDYGDDYWTDRVYQAVDPEGHHWWFMQRLRGPKRGS